MRFLLSLSLSLGALTLAACGGGAAAIPFCGDGTVDEGEVCDDGNSIIELCAYGAASCRVCSAGCKLIAGAASRCGDGLLQTLRGEECDDGNTTTEPCPDGGACQVCDSVCRLQTSTGPRCGDGTVHASRGETCDDGNLETEDCPYGQDGGCSVCGPACTTVAGRALRCGDQLTSAAFGETCDDGNTETERCAYGETCFVCDATCVRVAGESSTCGDGTLQADAGETCDDGNGVSELCGYGAGPCQICNASCQDAAGVTSACGDGKTDVAFGETCDDGNGTTADGCGSCAVESGYTCKGQPSQCYRASDVFASTGSSVSAVDGAYDGGLASMGCLNVAVPAVDDGGTGAVRAVQVTVAATIPSVRDTTLKVVSPSGTVVTLLSIPQISESHDDGSAVGTSAPPSLTSASPIFFADGAETSAEDIGVLGSSIVACASDGLCTFDPHAGAAHPGKLSAFNGQRSDGMWKVCAGDSEANGSSVTLDSVSLTVLR